MKRRRRDRKNSGSYVSSDSAATSGSYSSCHSEELDNAKKYKKIKTGLRKSIPAAIVLWAFHKLPSRKGLTSRRVINFLKKHYKVIDDPRKTGVSIGSMLRCAVEFGLLEKRGNRYFLLENHR